ncbi:MAG: SRPBCC family protein [Chthoniobacterales bacterium]
MEKSTFVYVTFIRTTPEKLWAKLTETEIPREFFWATTLHGEIRAGAKWHSTAPDGTVVDGGEILELDPPKRLVLSWQHEMQEEKKAEGVSRMTYTLEPKEGMVKLTVLHEMDRGQSKFIEAVSNGWPVILSSLKTLLETGEALEDTRTW